MRCRQGSESLGGEPACRRPGTGPAGAWTRLPEHPTGFPRASSPLKSRAPGVTQQPLPCSPGAGPAEHPFLPWRVEMADPELQGSAGEGGAEEAASHRARCRRKQCGKTSKLRLASWHRQLLILCWLRRARPHLHLGKAGSRHSDVHRRPGLQGAPGAAIQTERAAPFPPPPQPRRSPRECAEPPQGRV